MRQWTKQTDAEADEFFATLSEAEIRRRQDLCAQQIVVAHNNEDLWDRDDTMADLHAMEDALTRAMLARLDEGTRT